MEMEKDEKRRKQKKTKEKNGSDEYRVSRDWYPVFLLARCFPFEKRRPFLPSVWNKKFILVLFYDFIFTETNINYGCGLRNSVVQGRFIEW